MKTFQFIFEQYSVLLKLLINIILYTTYFGSFLFVFRLFHLIIPTPMCMRLYIYILDR